MKQIFNVVVLTLLFSGFWGCKSKSDDTTPSSSTQYAMVIKSGGQAVTVGNTFQFEAQLVGVDGTIIPITSGITYTSSATGVATFLGNTVTGVGQGTATVTASYTYKGATFMASVPLSIQPPQSVFAVNPWTIWWEADGTEFELNTIYFGTSTPNFNYSSSDPSIATVTAAGVVKVLKAGSCVIKVKATNLDGQPTVEVPVLVFGKPTVALPVTQVRITPGSYEMFKGEDKAFTAKAFKGDGSEVTGKPIKWWLKTTDSLDIGPAASVDQTGKVTAIRVGEASVYAEIEGIVSQANITINPDYALFIEPFFVSIKADKSQNFTLKTYKVDRAKYRANDPTAISVVPNPANVVWSLPLSDLPGFPNAFSITASNSLGCTVKALSSATVGMPGFLLASVNNDTYAEGGASMQVAIADVCDCGANDPNVASISVASTVVSLSAFQTFSLNARALNGSGIEVFGTTINYCSDNILVAAVGLDGEIQGIQPGTAIVTACVGNVKKEITVTVN